MGNSYQIAYKLCIYSGIYRAIDHELKYGTINKSDELSWIVNKYCEEELLSGNSLKEKLNEYLEFAKVKYGV